MIQTTSGSWIHRHDLLRGDFAPNDTTEERDACVSALSKLYRRKRVHAGHDIASAASAAANKIRAAVRPTVNTEPTIAELKQTVDALLSFVPRREAAVATPRIMEILQGIVSHAQQSVPAFVSATAIVTDESDPETVACHRAVVRLFVEPPQDAELLAPAIFALHRKFSELTTTQERLAIALLVEIADTDAPLIDAQAIRA